MGEMSTRVKDDASGDHVGTRDAYEVDEGANARTIQMVDWAFRHFSFDLGTPLRTVSASDASEISSVPAEITGSKLSVGDKTMLVVAVQYSVSSAGDEDAAVIVTPILLDGNDDAIGLLPPKKFKGISLSGGGANVLHRQISTVDWNLCVVEAWDVRGASQIGLHIILRHDTGVTARIWADVITGHPDAHGMRPDNFGMQAYAQKS